MSKDNKRKNNLREEVQRQHDNLVGEASCYEARNKHLRQEVNRYVDAAATGAANAKEYAAMLEREIEKNHLIRRLLEIQAQDLEVALDLPDTGEATREAVEHRVKEAYEAGWERGKHGVEEEKGDRIEEARNIVEAYERGFDIGWKAAKGTMVGEEAAYLRGFRSGCFNTEKDQEAEAVE